MKVEGLIAGIAHFRLSEMMDSKRFQPGRTSRHVLVANNVPETRTRVLLLDGGPQCLGGLR
jgi:hypothetical protein